MMTGMIMTTMIAHISHQRIPFSPAFLAATMIGMVCALEVERKTAKRYSFQFRMRVSSVVAASPGRVSGSTISQKIPNRVQPSSWADSSSSMGRPTKKSCINQTTIGRLATAYMMMSPKWVSSSPTDWNIM